jgi:Ser/Thr protein kinase RdoA (MazF antagonist)
VTTIEEVLPRVDVWRGRDLTVAELSGGLTNANYLVDAEGDRYVVRIPGASTELLAIDRANERDNAAAAATTGVSPPIVEILEDVDVMVIAYVDGATMSAEALRTPEQVPRIAASLRRLHAGPRFREDFDMFRLADVYLDVCATRDIPIPGGFREHFAASMSHFGLQSHQSESSIGSAPSRSGMIRRHLKSTGALTTGASWARFRCGVSA